MSSIITNVRKNSSGDIVAVKLSDGREMNLRDAVVLAEKAQIDGVVVGTDRAGNKYLHSKRGIADYRLSELPPF